VVCWQTQWIVNLVVFPLLELELETPFVLVVLEETVQNDLLVFLYDSIFAFDESREKSQVFCCQESLAPCLLKERIDEFNDFVLGNGRLNRSRVVLQNANQTFLNVRSVYVVGMLEEKVDPSREVNSVVFISDGNLLEKLVSALKNFRNFVSQGPVF
jgi:hypothetical protein